MSGSDALAEAAFDEPGAAFRPVHQIHPARIVVRDWRKPVGGRGKRAFDIAVSLVLLTLLALPFLVIAIAIRLESKGPVFFLQRRGGLHRRSFLIVKFRTMTTVDDGNVIAQAVRNDARITRVGRFLRDTRIDELPQLINVLRGEMSLVGPRPHAVAHDAAFRAVDKRYSRRFFARPGMTGLAQVTGFRGMVEDEAHIRRRLDLDLTYNRHWSFMLDCWLLVRTALLFWQPRRDPVLARVLPQAEAVFATAPSAPAATEQKLRIVHVITRFIRGGADENTLLSCNAQAAAGHEVTLIYGRDAHADMLARLDPRVRQVSVPALVRCISALNDAAALVALIRCIRRAKADIVHTHTSKAGILGRLAARIAKSRAVVHGVHILPHINVGRIERIVYVALERLAAPFTDAFVSVSPGMRDGCLDARIGSASAHIVIPSGMDISRFRGAAPFSRAELLREAQIVDRGQAVRPVVMAAALEPRKRVAEFVDAFAEVAQQDTDALLLVLGEGPERERIEARVRALGLEERVRLLGFRSDVERWLASASVCVLASEREGLPRVVVQYVLAGRPVVVSDLPGIEAVVRDGENGFVTPADDVEAMAAPVTRLLKDKRLAEAFAQAALSRDLSAWSVETMTADLEHVYAAVLSGAPAPSQLHGGQTWIS